MRIFRLFFFPLVLLLFVFTSCKNQLPEASIIAPTTGDEFTVGETVSIILNAKDPDGKVKTIEIFAGNELLTTLYSIPFIYEWDTEDMEPGDYTITAYVYDDKDDVSTVNTTIELLQYMEPPTVETLAATEISESTATLNGNIVSDGFTPITESGFYWGTNSNPGSDDNVELVNNTSGNYSFTLTGLEASTTYYFCAYAINKKGEVKGSVKSFTTNKEIEVGTFTDSRDGHVYKTLNIDGTIWMTENMAYLPSVSPSSEGSDYNKYYYVYGYEGIDVSEARNSENYSKYGVLYNLPSALYACPSGWYLPRDRDWEKLGSYISKNFGPYSLDADGSWLNIGIHLKSSYDWQDGDNGSDDIGFTGLPGGARTSNGMFYGKNNFAVWWTSTESNYNEYWMWTLQTWDNNLSKDEFYRMWGLSVRCIKAN
ncbi:MAG: hypothetical protein JW798_03315 [Prolixibacteraceae bacterium]|nr:hypothetical protein [Prolixibacteraceae bacterium]